MSDSFRQRAGQERLSSGLIAIAVVVVAGSEHAFASPPDHQICVDSNLTLPATRCGFPCDEIEPDPGSGLTAAADHQTANGPTSIRVCATEPVPIFESLDIDNSGNAFGTPLTLHLGGQPFCGDQAAPASEPAVQWSAGLGDTLIGLNVDLRDGGACGTPVRRPGLHARGSSLLYVDLLSLQGTVDYALGVNLDGTGGEILHSGNGHFIGNCEGSAVRAAGLAMLQDLVIAGCRTDSATDGEALLEAIEPGGYFVLKDSVIFGNLANGVSALILDSHPGLDNVTFAANGLGPGVPLVRSGLPASTMFVGPDGPYDVSPTSWKHNVFSRNRHVVVPPTFTLP